MTRTIELIILFLFCTGKIIFLATQSAIKERVPSNAVKRFFMKSKIRFNRFLPYSKVAKHVKGSHRRMHGVARYNTAAGVKHFDGADVL